ncbi:hypothetical protein [Pseudonocardia sp. ICBG1293]|uniref:hypothetical protein n=1 Tax=Pseudonocardia sp. ICBG1293 TaxID=2844382 RepID=UPI001CC96948|nr:hypothetical protein [Pseudonocardia sp. ICBG1293]
MSTKKFASASRVIGTVLVVAVSMGLATGVASAEVPAASPAPEDNFYSLATDSGQERDRVEGLTLFLERVNSVPDSVLHRGDSATQDWLRANYPDSGGQSRASVIGCVGAIGVAVGGVLVPAAKILKIKKLIAQLGGIREAVQTFWGASFAWEKIQAIGGPVAALGAELLGITAVRTQCFS